MGQKHTVTVASSAELHSFMNSHVVCFNGLLYSLHDATHPRWETLETSKTFYIWQVKHSLSLLTGLVVVVVYLWSQSCSTISTFPGHISSYSAGPPDILDSLDWKLRLACKRQHEGTGTPLLHVLRLRVFLIQSDVVVVLTNGKNILVVGLFMAAEGLTSWDGYLTSFKLHYLKSFYQQRIRWLRLMSRICWGTTASLLAFPPFFYSTLLLHVPINTILFHVD